MSKESVRQETRKERRRTRVINAARRFMEAKGEEDQAELDDLMVGVGRLYVEISGRFLPAEIAPGTTTDGAPGILCYLPSWEKRWQRITARIHAVEG